VLSFPLLPPTSFGRVPADGAGASRVATHETPFAIPPGRRQHLGDIVVSVERARDQAEAGHGGQTGTVRWSAADELRLLATHGTLHICGWDHAAPDQEAEMRALEQRLLAR
jgi:probable rRNA maturation factor